MDIKEAYEVMQKAWVEKYGIVRGSRVRILRSNDGHELGSFAILHSQGEFDSYPHKTATVKDVECRSVAIDVDGDQVRYYPWFALEFISSPESEDMIDINGKKWSISTVKEALKKHAN